MVDLGRATKHVFRGVLQLKHAIPSHDTLSPVLRMIDPKAASGARTVRAAGSIAQKRSERDDPRELWRASHCHHGNSLIFAPLQTDVPQRGVFEIASMVNSDRPVIPTSASAARNLAMCGVWPWAASAASLSHSS
jgi:hypothetical protein